MTESTAELKAKAIVDMKAKMSGGRRDRIAAKRKRWDDGDAGRGIKSDASASVALVNQKLAVAIEDTLTDVVFLMVGSKYDMLDVIAASIVKSLAPYAARIATLEGELKQRSYQGVWEEGEQYSKENSVTFSGSLWIALEDTTDKPGQSDAWQLAVKRGRSAR